MISMQIEDYEELNRELECICKQKSKEIKWGNVTEAIGKELINFTYENLHQLRVDVLIWDIEDSRHKNVRQDEIENLQRLYYRLMLTVMRDRWQDNAIWALFPDEQKGIDWDVVRSFLMSKSKQDSIEIALNQRINFITKTHYENAGILPANSQDHPFIQLADFFAGIACYSHKEFAKICAYKDQVIGQSNIFEKCDFVDDMPTLSSRDKIRIPLVWHISAKSKKHKYGVALESTKGLVTHNPKSPVNFWLYKPQHELDKAPRKKDS